MNVAPTKAQHDYAVYLFQQGFYTDTVLQLDEVLRIEESAERWSDWATAQFGLNQFSEAEKGFRRALELDPGLADAAVNFGMMLSGQGRFAEAVECFEKALPQLQGDARNAVENFIRQGRAQLLPAAPEPPRPESRRKKRRAKAKR
jgi:Tfp pilus assembly protein PilF